jgi:hypothetical protein
MTKARDLANASTALSAVSATELGYVDGVTSAIQTQIDTKAASSTAVTLTGTQTLTNKTLTNPVIASVINNTLTSTTGDIIYASAANTPARLGIGSTSQVLTVAGGIPSWATPTNSGMTLLSTTTLSGTSTSVNVTATGYKDLVAYVSGAGTGAANYNYGVRVNSITANYVYKNTSAVSGGTILNTAGSTSTIDFNQPGNISCFGANTLNTFVVTIFDVNSSRKKLVTVNGSYINMDGTNLVMTNDVVATDATSAITNISVISNTSLTSGTIEIYGVK